MKNCESQISKLAESADVNKKNDLLMATLDLIYSFLIAQRIIPKRLDVDS